MEEYKLPRSALVSPEVHRGLKGDLIVVFGDGLLCGMAYRPLGLNSLWSLVGAVASMGEPFSFQVKESMTAPGIMGGFKDSGFCLFEVGNKEITVFTAAVLHPAGSSRITVYDKRHETFFWVPDRAMMPFEQLAVVGNSVLLGHHSHVTTHVGQRYSHWLNDKYA